MHLSWRRVVGSAMLVLGSIAGIAAAAPPAAAVIDGPEDFVLLASRGFAYGVDGVHPQGTLRNAIVWSMAWFNDQLFVGTAALSGNPAEWGRLGGQIWRYTPGGPAGVAGVWTLAYESPVAGIPIDGGYRWMQVCDVGDGVPRLYVVTFGPLGGRVLYTADGITFTAASMTGLRREDLGYRPLVCFTTPGGTRLLVTSPVGKLFDLETPTITSDLSDNPIVLATDNPLTGSWHAYSPLRFGDPDNESIFTMAGFDRDADGHADVLYAGVTNIPGGFQLWKAEGCDPFPSCVPIWKRVIDRGAGRPPAPSDTAPNAAVSHSVQHGQALFVATGSRAELLRVHPDDTWELLIGRPRVRSTMEAEHSNFLCAPGDPDGGGPLGPGDGCVPLANMGIGIGGGAPDYAEGGAVSLWHLLSADDGRLYAGTLEGFNLPVATPGFDLLVSGDDGVTWSHIADNGLGNPTQGGLRTMASTPLGIFVGTGSISDIFQSSASLGGCDVWLGMPSAPTVRPFPPFDVAAARLAARTIRVTWKDAIGETSYEVERCRRSPLARCTFAAVAPSLPADSTAYDSVVPSPGVYAFRVRACNAEGCSPWSATVSAFAW
jgi:hypothetical protein